MIIHHIHTNKYLTLIHKLIAQFVTSNNVWTEDKTLRSDGRGDRKDTLCVRVPP